MTAKKKTGPILCASCGRPMLLGRRVYYNCVNEKPVSVYAFVCTHCLMRSPPVSTMDGWSKQKAKRCATYLAVRLSNLARAGADARAQLPQRA